MSESAATAWIIERLEIENSKIEQEVGNLDTSEEQSAEGARECYVKSCRTGRSMRS